MGYSPLDADWQLPGPRDRLDDDVALLYATCEQLRLGALKQRVDDLGVPPGVDDANAQAGAVVLLWGWALHVDSDCFAESVCTEEVSMWKKSVFGSFVKLLAS